MKNNYEFRKAGLADLAKIRQILQENNRGSAEEALKLLNEKGLKTEPSLFMFNCDGQTAGLLYYERCGGHLLQIDWYLLDEYKHRNLGTVMTRTMAEYVNRKGYDCLITFPMNDLVKMTIARKLGFERIDCPLPQIAYLRKRA